LVRAPSKTGGAVKLTTARYFTPNGRSIQAQGIEPDIVANPATVQREDSRGLEPLSESNLSGHLSNGNGEKEEADAEKTEEKDDTSRLVEEDYQLYEALNLLKGLALLNAKK